MWHTPPLLEVGTIKDNTPCVQQPYNHEVCMSEITILQAFPAWVQPHPLQVGNR